MKYSALFEWCLLIKQHKMIHSLPKNVSECSIYWSYSWERHFFLHIYFSFTMISLACCSVGNVGIARVLSEHQKSSFIGQCPDLRQRVFLTEKAQLVLFRQSFRQLVERYFTILLFCSRKHRVLCLFENPLIKWPIFLFYFHVAFRMLK